MLDKGFADVNVGVLRPAEMYWNPWLLLEVKEIVVDLL